MRRYVTFCCAVSADAAGRSTPVAGSGTSASRGTSTSPPAAPDGGSVRTRLGIQPPPYGAGSSAGSPSAAQTRRPASSPKPAIGFHAAAGRDATPRRDRKSTRLNSSHSQISYAVFCLKKKKPSTLQAKLTLLQKLLAVAHCAAEISAVTATQQ